MTTIVSSYFGVRDHPDSLARVTYKSQEVGPNRAFSRVELRSFTMAVQPNIVDWSAHNSLHNNIFTFDYGGTGYTASIPPGSYDGPGLADELMILMNDLTSTTNFTVDYNPNTAKFIFDSASGDIELDFTSDTSPWLELGFDQAVYGPTGTIESLFQVQLSWSPYFLINIPELTAATTNYCHGNATTFAIPVSVPGTYNQVWSYLTDGPAHVQEWTQPKLTSQFTISILFLRAGQLYPLIGDANTEYTITFAYLFNPAFRGFPIP